MLGDDSVSGRPSISSIGKCNSRPNMRMCGEALAVLCSLDLYAIINMGRLTSQQFSFSDAVRLSIISKGLLNLSTMPSD